MTYRCEDCHNEFEFTELDQGLEDFISILPEDEQQHTRDQFKIKCRECLYKLGRDFVKSIIQMITNGKGKDPEKYTCCACFKIFKFGDFPKHDKEMQEDKKAFKDAPFIHLQYMCEPCAKKICKEMDEDDKRSKAHLN